MYVTTLKYTHKKKIKHSYHFGNALLSWDVSEISKLLILIVHSLIKLHLQECLIRFYNQLLQICTARIVFSILVIHCDAGGVSLVDQ